MDLERDDQTGRVLGAAVEVHRTLGPGFLESVYEKALAIELARRQIPFIRQVEVPVLDEKGRRWYLAMVSNMWEGTPEAVWNWAKERCGTVELVHSVIKSDLLSTEGREKHLRRESFLRRSAS